ncbi:MULTISPECIES: metallophosphoesterase family protein [Thioclava]|mgnify:CR=1 FL=1|uniref:metallophosphoesterase family protein n=1 Tax=Thioclava TaxID=285107 RepID=UPI000C63BCF2|nr:MULTISPECIES: metallophosphoesterase family protein [Thioclava]MAQ35853.1 phosphodiesterase [Thioclava sp.]
MTRIVHLSDLHFGRSLPELEAPLLTAVNRLAPDLTVISGDFTQRARRGQFAQARLFVEQIESETLSVPGNHDTPLDNLFLRMLKPFGRYKSDINHNLEPVFETDRLKAVGVNTVNRFAWQRGKVPERTISRLCREFGEAGERLRIAVMHHPLEHGPEVDKALMDGAGDALEGMSDCGADLVLSGHLHTGSVAPFSAVPGILFVQAGTGLSSRLRGEPNTFNVIEGGRDALSITLYGARDMSFEPIGADEFTRGPDGAWVKG